MYQPLDSDQKVDVPTLAMQLASIVGSKGVITDPDRMRPYCTGYREGAGAAVAVVRPRTLLQQWEAFKACVAAGCIVITQAANTGLTGGSTPEGEYDRPVVVMNTMHIKGIFPIRGGQQVVCLPGSTLDELEGTLAPLGREPHSVLGSSCLGASVVGGICNNSGGALLSRGPAYTEYAVYACVGPNRSVRFHNHLGIELGETPEEILSRLASGNFGDSDVHDNSQKASADDYETIVRSVDASTPARHNNDPARLYEVSGSAGRTMVFAVRVDSFQSAGDAATFYIGTNDPACLSSVRRHILTNAEFLPTSAEYIHKDAFDSAAVYGKDIFCLIRRLGTARLPALFALKSRVDRLSKKLPLVPAHLADRLLQFAYRFTPGHLPKRMLQYRQKYDHHLIVKASGPAIQETRRLLGDILTREAGAMFECTADEARAAFLHRFAVAGAAVRQQIVDDRLIEGIVALDVALARNDPNWFEVLPDEIERRLIGKFYYGHFFCHVFHQDYLVRRGESVDEVKAALLNLMEARGARHPAEHNVGHRYKADEPLVRHYQSLDPTNSLNPGLGMTSRKEGWA
ncbi:D-lactate dehydrogenase [Novosphingobium lindaniclasticum]|uniref:Quinone-dependent D-lactate dehydrogenase n=1 Tax=Novosphingobium lindaniclasticum LE124 TaxID=1096930 RepID=T0IYB8_9SPHN|nr:D-lactate dehydrogenase [Novosphingobium lindaniclasticum]EQB16850.1 hypothetical protein L284_09145 [Novosphingobium lindaniclasticum LE124]